MSATDFQGWATLAIAVVLLIRTFVGDGKKQFERIAKSVDDARSDFRTEMLVSKAETANLRANLSDFQLKVAQEYARNEQLGPRLDRIEGMLTDVLTGRRHER